MDSQAGFSKGRSPRYPRISIDSAIAYARRLYDEAHRASVDSDTAIRLMGFSGKSGSSAVVIGALRQFGLVEGLRGAVRVSDLALRILQPGSREEEEEARHEAAFKPEAYDVVVAHFDGELPRSDEPIKAYLIRTLGFSRPGAEECIATLRRTLAELADYRSELPEAEPRQTSFVRDAPSDESIHSAVPAAETKPAASARDAPAGELIRIPLSRECTAELRLVGPVTSSAIERLVQYINLMKEVWAEE